MVVERVSFEKFTGTVLGSYRLEQLIEHGKTGPVFLARGTQGDTTYTVRFLTAPANLDPQARIVYLGRFQQEANQVSALRHPHILPLLDYGNYQGMPYLVMPRLPLTSLYTQVKQAGPLDVLTASRYLDQIAAALDDAHRQGILHRNLNPLCIFLQNSKMLVVGDFGVMRMLELAMGGSTRQANALYGSSETCAPEILSDAPATTTDIYALGGVLYRLLTAHSAYGGKTAEEIIQQHLRAPTPSLGLWRKDVPPGLDAIIAKAMAKNPAQRFQQAGELANAYHQVVAPNDTARPMIAIPLAPARGATTRAGELSRRGDSRGRPATRAGELSRSGRPALAGARPTNAGSSLSRRRFLVVAAAGVGVVAIGAVAFAGTHLLSGNTTSTASTAAATPAPTNPQATHATRSGGTVLAHTADVPVNSAKKIAIPNSNDPGVLIHLPGDSFVAYDAVCTHASCTVDYIPQTKLLLCPCHGAEFDPAKNAAVVQEPAPTPLAPVKITVNADGTITAG